MFLNRNSYKDIPHVFFMGDILYGCENWNNISNQECNIAGSILGRIHAIEPQNVSHKEPELSKINWQEYIHKANDEKMRSHPY